MKLAVVGTGYVGLVTGTCFAESGNQVVCIDIDAEKVKLMKEGKVPIYEPGLDTLFERNIAQERLSFTTNLEEGIREAKVIFLALPTPPGADGSADLQYVLDVSKKLGPMLKEYTVIVNKSTVPVGTADKVRNAVAENCKVEFDVVSNPEFLKEGYAVEDFMKPDRIVIGTRSHRAREIMEKLYKPFVRQGNPIIFMDERSSEMTKYAANAFLATKITFMNEIANLCDRVGANVDMVRRGIGTDVRIGKHFLYSGIGYGGSCFPKDVQAIVKTAHENDMNLEILEAVIRINEKQKTILIPKMKEYFGGSLKGRRVAIWGLAFKANTDDIREAPALYIIEELLKEGAEVVVHDPEALNNVRKLFGDKIKYSELQYEALDEADCLMIVTDWQSFRNPNFGKVAIKLKNKVIFDGRNLFEHDEMAEIGFTYFSIGRNKAFEMSKKQS
ncbi:MAG TPA: UDP-glucose/GDP-mannose dehydrogenase family protein [Bacteroidia bacterium]|nr:UDP-glucose/GDP-mannose dehydrogenase family protein [Bacteroidia bacterium]HRS58705.1 UDP-glucose/GDP-mannose dehydrogenase family protein [Bacteroidia bacterium]HRU68372.1 UDP-glucose/GDP-mannose dehydrogenase family protein [Bacteroidia bacterium]